MIKGFVNNMIPSEVIQALGWTVIHSLWQGIIIGAVLALLTFTVFRNSSRSRFILSSIGAAVMFGLAVTTFINQISIRASSHEVLLVNIPSEAVFAPDIMNDITLFVTANMHWVTILWLLGVLVSSLRFAGSMAYLRQLRNSMIETIPEEWEMKFRELKTFYNIKIDLALGLSRQISSPVLLGFVKPVILMPIASVNQITIEELEAILAHEIAHVKRSDYLLNFFFALFEILFFFNPVAWWLLGVIRSEREHCCDELALDYCSPIQYAKSLLRVQELQIVNTRLSLNFGGQRNSFDERVKRILQIKTSIRNRLDYMILPVIMIAGFMLFVGFAYEQKDDKTSVRVLQDTVTDKIDLSSAPTAPPAPPAPHAPPPPPPPAPAAPPVPPVPQQPVEVQVPEIELSSLENIDDLLEDVLIFEDELDPIKELASQLISDFSVVLDRQEVLADELHDDRDGLQSRYLDLFQRFEDLQYQELDFKRQEKELEVDRRTDFMFPIDLDLELQRLFGQDGHIEENHILSEIFKNLEVQVRQTEDLLESIEIKTTGELNNRIQISFGSEPQIIIESNN